MHGELKLKIINVIQVMHVDITAVQFKLADRVACWDYVPATTVSNIYITRSGIIITIIIIAITATVSL